MPVYIESFSIQFVISFWHYGSYFDYEITFSRSQFPSCKNISKNQTNPSDKIDSEKKHYSKSLFSIEYPQLVFRLFCCIDYSKPNRDGITSAQKLLISNRKIHQTWWTESVQWNTKKCQKYDWNFPVLNFFVNNFLKNLSFGKAFNRLRSVEETTNGLQWFFIVRKLVQKE